jgi:hypothetical protein
MTIQNKENNENLYIFNSHLNHLFDIEDDDIYQTHKSFYKNLEKKYKNDNFSNKGGDNE